MSWRRIMPLLLLTAVQCGLLYGQSSLDLSGRVVDCTNSRPIPNSTIRLDAVPNAIVTDEAGRFFIYDLKAGTYRVTAEAPAYYTRSDYEVVVSKGFLASYTICLRPRLYRADPLVVTGSPDAETHGAVTVLRGSPEFQSSASLGELVETIPDLVVNYTGGKQGEATVSVRGGPSKEVLVLLDGVSVNSPITGAADVNSIPLSSVSKVEFTSGGMSSRFGSGAVGGVLNIVTTTAARTSRYEIAGTSGEPGAAAWENRARLRIDRGTSVAGSYSGSTAANDYMFDSVKEGILRRENADIKRMNANVSAVRQLGSSAKLTATYHLFDQSNGLPGFVYQLNPVSRKDESRGILSLTTQAECKKSFYSASYSYRRTNQIFKDTFAYTLLKTHSKYIDRLHQMNLRGGLRLPRSTRFEASVDAGWERFSTENLLDPSRPAFNDVVERRASFMLSAEKSWTLENSSQRFGVDALLRLRNDCSSNFEPIFTPYIHLGSSYARWFKLRGEFSYGSSYRAPLYSSLFWNDGVSAVGNPDLEPERLEESSASLRISVPVIGDLSVETIYQHSAYGGLIHWQLVQINKFKPFNLSRSLIFTRTLNIKWAVRPLNLTVDYSSVDQESKDRSWIRTHHNRQLTYRPRFIQHLSLRHSSSHLDVHYRLRHLSRRFTRAENTKWLDGYTVADFMAAVKYDFRLVAVRIQYDIENATGADYQLIEGCPNPGQLWSIHVRLTFKLDAKL